MLGVGGVLSRVSELRDHLGFDQAPVAATAPAGSDFATVLARASAADPARAAAPASPAGPVAFSGVPMAARQALKEAPPPVAAPRSAALVSPYAEIFQTVGMRYDVPPRLLAAVAKVESDFNPGAVSSSGAQGLMQLMPSTARGLGVRDPFDPAQAVDGAARLLRQHMREFGSVELALAAYNAGAGAVRRHDGIPPYAQTQAYVPKVQKALAALGG
ncbi:hypothetical protein Acsp01_36340 [Actinoplanes sp. NBRC 101535]|nr:hypothetical protein Acsp01_36340 [Actinoplanes sp. NBRC 101535]